MVCRLVCSVVVLTEKMVENDTMNFSGLTICHKRIGSNQVLPLANRNHSLSIDINNYNIDGTSENISTK